MSTLKEASKSCLEPAVPIATPAAQHGAIQCSWGCPKAETEDWRKLIVVLLGNLQAYVQKVRETDRQTDKEELSEIYK